MDRAFLEFGVTSKIVIVLQLCCFAAVRKVYVFPVVGSVAQPCEPFLWFKAGSWPEPLMLLMQSEEDVEDLLRTSA